jgi:hypothetical protein
LAGQTFGPGTESELLDRQTATEASTGRNASDNL